MKELIRRVQSMSTRVRHNWSTEYAQSIQWEQKMLTENIDTTDTLFWFFSKGFYRVYWGHTSILLSQTMMKHTKKWWVIFTEFSSKLNCHEGTTLATITKFREYKRNLKCTLNTRDLSIHCLSLTYQTNQSKMKQWRRHLWSYQRALYANT